MAERKDTANIRMSSNCVLRSKHVCSLETQTMLGTVLKECHAFFNQCLHPPSQCHTSRTPPKIVHILELENPMITPLQYALMNLVRSALSDYSCNCIVL